MDKSGQVLYVGKAKKLRHRLQSYSRDGLLERTKRLVEITYETRYQVMESEIQALIVEAELIKRYQPKFNVRLKDDKSPLYIAIGSEKFPRIRVMRGHELGKGKLVHYFGPFQSGIQVRRLLKIVRRLFPYCSSLSTSRKRACFYVHLELCPGACVGEVTQREYQKTIRDIIRFLSGEHDTLVKRMEGNIGKLAKAKQYEKASRLKKQLEALKYVSERNRVMDDDMPLPNLAEDKFAVQKKALSQMLVNTVNFRQNKLFRIEGYDVSNLSGQMATASMVVFTEGKPDTSEYRRFKIRGFRDADDPGMIAQALSRRLNHDEWDFPDLILIDGGRTQLTSAIKVINKTRLMIPIIALAKKPDRVVYCSSYADPPKFDLVPLKKHHSASQLLQFIRDESHRFAKQYHKKLRSKSWNR